MLRASYWLEPSSLLAGRDGAVSELGGGPWRLGTCNSHQHPLEGRGGRGPCW